jgi:hypothetical protein
MKSSTLAQETERRRLWFIENQNRFSVEQNGYSILPIEP